MVKPFSPAELVARVDAVLRRTRDDDGARTPLRFGDLEIDPAARSVASRAREVELTQREFDLLHFLARHPGQVFSRDQLMDRVWRFSFYTDTTTVTVHVRRLRAKIEPDPARHGSSRRCGASATASGRRRDEPFACDRRRRRSARRADHRARLRGAPGAGHRRAGRGGLDRRASRWRTASPAAARAVRCAAGSRSWSRSRSA